MLAQAEGHVIVDRQAVEQRGHLKQEPEPQPELDKLLAAQPVDVRAVEPDASLGGMQQADDQLEHDGLAAAALADDANRLAPVDGQVDTAKHALRAEPHGQIAELDQILAPVSNESGPVTHINPWACGQIDR